MTQAKVELFVLGNLLYVFNPFLEPVSNPQNGNDPLLYYTDLQFL